MDLNKAFEPYLAPLIRRETRLKRIMVPPEYIIHTLTKTEYNQYCIRIPTLKLPTDVRVLGVDYKPSWRAFEFTIASDTFEALKEDAEIPILDIEYTVKELRLPE